MIKKIKKRYASLALIPFTAAFIFARTPLETAKPQFQKNEKKEAVQEESLHAAPSLTQKPFLPLNGTKNADSEAKQAKNEDKADLSSALSKDSSAESSLKKEKNGNDKTPAPEAGKKKKKAETDFASIQATGLTLCNGGKWYFEEFAEDGNIASSVLYDKDTLLEKQTFSYKNKKLSKTVIEYPEKIIETLYNEKGFEIENAEYENEDGEKADLIKKVEKSYDEKNNVVKLSENDGTKTVTVKYSYGKDGKVKIEETLYGEVLVCRVEYKAKTKNVTIFDEGKPLRSFEEEL